ncbi:MAG: hypothetical protein AAF558_02985 [Verrucomicrobiota bacterium]
MILSLLTPLFATIEFEEGLRQLVKLLSMISAVALFGAFILACIMAATGRIAAMGAAIFAAIVAALGWSFLTKLFETFGGGTVTLPSF